MQFDRAALAHVRVALTVTAGAPYISRVSDVLYEGPQHARTHRLRPRRGAGGGTNTLGCFANRLTSTACGSASIGGCARNRTRYRRETLGGVSAGQGLSSGHGALRGLTARRVHQRGGVPERHRSARPRVAPRIVAAERRRDARRRAAARPVLRTSPVDCNLITRQNGGIVRRDCIPTPDVGAGQSTPALARHAEGPQLPRVFRAAADAPGVSAGQRLAIWPSESGASHTPAR